ncbi:MAG: cyclic-phosphate processing receiver domain-containing protein [Pyrinomonadaceae bacterium]
MFNRLAMAFGASTHTPINIFVLEDDLERHEWFEKKFSRDHVDIATDVPHAIRLLERNIYDMIYLDHDLLPEHYGAPELPTDRCGHNVAMWLAEHPEKQRNARIIVHTRNAEGAFRMVELLRATGRSAEYIPFPILSQR